MHEYDIAGGKRYRLEIGADGRGPARMFEFAADGPVEAFYVAQRQSPAGSRIDLFEDGRPLARLRRAPDCGFWIIEPSLASAMNNQTGKNSLTA